MSQIPKESSEIYEAFIQDFKTVYGADLIAIILYGSAARGEYVYKKSDINFLIILSENGMAQLDNCMSLLPKWWKRHVNTPLFLTEDYIQSSLDAFPIEFLAIKLDYKVIYGTDVMHEIELEDEHLRLQCEREIKGKLLQLRSGFLNSGGKAAKMKQLISESTVTFMAIFMALLTLKKIPLPGSQREILIKTAKVFGLDEALFGKLVDIRSGSIKKSADELKVIINHYIQEIKKLSTVIDEFKNGGEK